MIDHRRLYAVSAAALNQGALMTSASAIYAEDDARAFNRASYEAYERWPVAEGWTQHSVSLVRVPNEMVQLAFNALAAAN